VKKKLTLMVFAAALISCAGCAFLTNFHYRAMKKYEKDPALAVYSGEIRVHGLSKGAHVYRDRYAVPHILAEEEQDLFFAVGYVQAQDRLWEMMFFRAVSQGRLAELMGDLEAPGVKMAGLPLSTVGIDEHQRIMGMRYLGEVGEAMLRETSPEVYSQLEAYCRGVNTFIDTHTEWEDLPVEFRILKVKPSHWRVADVVSFSKFIGSLLCSNMQIELPRYAAIKKYGPEKGWRLFPVYGAPKGPSIVPPDMLHNALSEPRDIPPGGRPSEREIGYDLPLDASAASALYLADAAVRRAFGADGSMGSNNWVVSGKLTDSGNAMLANDPHLQHVQPSLFYLMHIKGAGYDCAGVTFPGNPYLVLGHTRKFAWGATTSRADVQDLYVETTDPAHPGRYLYQGEWLPFMTREEIIKVRAGSKMYERRIEVRHTVHGPVINDFADLPEDAPPVTLRWTAWDMSRDLQAFEMAVSSRSAEEFMQKYKSMQEPFRFINITLALERLNRAESLDDFLEAMEKLDLPNQNWVAADRDGRIAYLPGGLVPLRKNGIGVLPAPGESGEFDWAGFIPLDELPRAIDPERGYMVTANNQVVDPRYYPRLFSTHYAEPWRAWRIEELIEELAPLDREDMVRIQNDIVVKRAEWQVPMILQAVERKGGDERARAAAAELEAWDFVADLDTGAAVIFFEFLRSLFDNVMEDEVDKQDLAALRIEGYPTMVVDLALEEGESDLFDDKRTAGVEDRDDMIVRSLSDAMKRVEKKWGEDANERKWGDIHVIKWFHVLGMGKGRAMSVGPFPHLGADHTVRNAKAAYFGSRPYKSMTGPCFKHVIDMGDPDNALMVIDGSQSGQWLSPHYDDMHPLFVEGKYIKVDMDPDRVMSNAHYHLALRPE